MPTENNSIDGIILTGVLEHVGTPGEAVKEMYRILKKNGKIFVSIPFLQPYHPDPADYQRYTIYGIQKLFERFQKIEVSNTRGSGSTVAWILVEFCAILFSGGRDLPYKLLKGIFGWLFFPIKYIDLFLLKNKKDYIITSGFTFIGKKQ